MLFLRPLLSHALDHANLNETLDNRSSTSSHHLPDLRDGRWLTPSVCLAQNRPDQPFVPIGSAGIEGNQVDQDRVRSGQAEGDRRLPNEYIRPDASEENFARHNPVFQPDGGKAIASTPRTW